MGVAVLYILSWYLLAHERGLYSFTANRVMTLGLERWASSRVVELDGFGGIDSPELRSVRQMLEAKGFRVCVATPASEFCDGMRDEAVTIESRVEALAPFDSIVSLSWVDGGRGEIRRYGFWWNGLAWSRDGRDVERLEIIVMGGAI